MRISEVFSNADAIGWAKYILMPGEERFIEDIDWVVPIIGRSSREDLYLKLKQAQEFASVRIERVGGLRGTALGPEHHSRSLRIGASSVGKDMTLKIAFNTWVYFQLSRLGAVLSPD